MSEIEIVVDDVDSANEIDSIIKLAVEQKADVENLEKLMEMKYRHDERQAVKLFDKNFCKMQEKIPVVKKNKSVSNAYKYAPLETIVDQVKPTLSSHGFSFRFSETQNESSKTVTCHISGHGHSQSSSVEIPIMSASKMTNLIQQMGSASTYGKRYSFMNALGITVEDEDDDASSYNQQPRQQNYNNSPQQTQQKSPPPQINREQAIGEFTRLFKSIDMTKVQDKEKLISFANSLNDKKLGEILTGIKRIKSITREVKK